jgi:MOSC domain-containing protein YiiM
MGVVLSVNSSPTRGTPKYPKGEGYFIENYGMEGDGHAGNWHRQVCVFDVSSLDALSAEEKAACEASYSENITTRGVALCTLPIGTRIEVGDTLLEIRQIGKDFVKDPSEHTLREVIMHREGVFCVVLKSGKVRVGDEVKVLL